MCFSFGPAGRPAARKKFYNFLIIIGVISPQLGVVSFGQCAARSRLADSERALASVALLQGRSGALLHARAHKPTSAPPGSCVQGASIVRRSASLGEAKIETGYLLSAL